MRNIYDAFEPLYKMQESIRKMTAPYDSAFAVFEQMNRTASIAMQITSAEWIAQQYPSLSAMQNVLQNIKFPLLMPPQKLWIIFPLSFWKSKLIWKSLKQFINKILNVLKMKILILNRQIQLPLDLNQKIPHLTVSLMFLI